MIFEANHPNIRASSVRAHIKGMTANDPSRQHYRLSGMTALFIRQSDKTLLASATVATNPLTTRLAVTSCSTKSNWATPVG